MRAICPNNREHKEFIVTAHVIQDWKVDESGMHLDTIDDCVEITYRPTIDDIWDCTICGASAITTGEIRELFATVLEGQEDSYLDVFDDEEEAKALIGTYYDDIKIVGIKKGYSIAPKGQKILYDEAPDFCHSYEEAVSEAKDLGIELY